MQLPVVSMSLNYDDQIENKSKSISFSINAEQFAVLLAGKILFLTLILSSFRLF